GVIGLNSRISGSVALTKKRLKKHWLSSGRNRRMPNRPIRVHITTPSRESITTAYSGTPVTIELWLLPRLAPSAMLSRTRMPGESPPPASGGSCVSADGSVVAHQRFAARDADLVDHPLGLLVRRRSHQGHHDHRDEAGDHADHAKAQVVEAEPGLHAVAHRQQVAPAGGQAD